jgi:hypothetical protein
MAKLTLTDISNESIPSASSTVNANNDLIEAALENTLSRDGTTPNAMSDDFDMGTNRIINLAAPTSDNDAARKVDIVPGADGSDGDDGALWYTGSGAPSGGTGADNDMYLDESTGDVYGPKASGTWPASALNIIGPAGAGTGDMLKSENLSGLANYATARSNLSLVPGTDVQVEDAGLTSIAGLTTAADRGIYTTALDTYAVFTLTSAGRSLLDDATVGDMRTTLGLGDSATKNTGTSSSEVAAGDDSRFDTLGVTTQSTAYTFGLTDAGRMIRSASGTHAWTVPPNSSVAFPTGTVISLRNGVSGGTITITRGSGVSIYIGGETTSKDPAFAAGGLATLVKEDTNVWVVSGAGLT